jgi:hypothetical protein
MQLLKAIVVLGLSISAVFAGTKEFKGIQGGKVVLNQDVLGDVDHELFRMATVQEIAVQRVKAYEGLLKHPLSEQAKADIRQQVETDYDKGLLKKNRNIRNIISKIKQALVDGARKVAKAKDSLTASSSSTARDIDLGFLSSSNSVAKQLQKAQKNKESQVQRIIDSEASQLGWGGLQHSANPFDNPFLDDDLRRLGGAAARSVL